MKNVKIRFRGGEKMKTELFQKDVKVTLKDGKVFTGLFYEIFWEENTIMIGNTIINIKDIEKMEELKQNNFTLELFNKNVIVILTDGEIFKGLFEEYYEEDNTIVINNIELNIDEIAEMKEIKSIFLNKLNKKQLEFLNKKIHNFLEKDTVEIVEFLTNYLQINCIIDNEITEDGNLVESILDILGEM